MNLIDFPTNRILPVRRLPVKAVIIHTTGDTDLDKILAFYTAPDGYQPHYFIETTGTIRRIVPEDHVAYHAAHDPAEMDAYDKGFGFWSSQRWIESTKSCVTYENGLYPGYKTWATQWHSSGVPSPLSLVTGRGVNACSIGIELQQPDENSITPDIFTNEQYAALSELLADVLPRNKVPFDRQHILGHYDVCPLRRSTLRGGWDPGEATNWTRILSSPSS